jgi:hypothetical protein
MQIFGIADAVKLAALASGLTGVTGGGLPRCWLGDRPNGLFNLGSFDLGRCLAGVMPLRPHHTSRSRLVRSECRDAG